MVGTKVSADDTVSADRREPPVELLDPPGSVTTGEPDAAPAALVEPVTNAEGRLSERRKSRDTHVHFAQENDIEKSAMHAAALDGAFMLVSALCGLLFGLAMEKARVFEPLVIRQQMVMERFIMLKMFLAAMGTSMAISAIMSLVPFHRIRYNVRQAFTGTEGPQLGRNALSLVVGGLLLGCGMTIAGACPGMVIVQFGAWASQAWLTLIGALVGNMVYGLLHDRFYKVLFPKDKFTLPLSLMDMTGFSYLLLAVPMVVAMAGACVGFEFAFPWRSEANTTGRGFENDSPTSFMNMVAWPPIFCGILLGALQLPLILFGHMLSGSGAYNALCAQTMCTAKLRDRFPYLGNRFARFTVGNWWQVIFALGAALGALGSALLSGSVGSVPGVPYHFAFIGGALMLFGARIAAGCTSGHGLTGSGMLLTGSLLAVACMFAGGIATAFIFKAAGEVYNVF